MGYRVNSYQATQFRIWATNTLREYITKGFVLNDDMLKNGQSFGKDYFEELLERIREIRASERRFIKKLLIFMLLLSITIGMHSQRKNFRIGTKQTALGYNREDCCRDYLYFG